MVIAAGGSGDLGPQALSDLCEIYWYPIYSFLRRSYSDADAKDLTQGFFESLIRRDDLAKLTTERGKFRTYLLSALKNFQCNAWRRENAMKRGGDVQIVSINFTDADEVYRSEPSDSMSPDVLFEARFAYALFERSIERLKVYYRGKRKDDLLEELLPFISPNAGERSYSEVSKNLGCSEGAARKAAHDIRNKLKECFRAEVFETVGDFSKVDDEIRYLISILGSHWPASA